MIDLLFTAEDWPLAQPFRFAGHTVTSLETILVRVTDGAQQGLGEGVMPIVFDMMMEQAKAQLTQARGAMAAGLSASAACAALPVDFHPELSRFFH